MHKSECSINYFEKSSGGMEEAAALVIFRRSVEKRKLRYTSMLGDSDVKAIGHINKHKPYGPEVEVSKEECVGHVAKRMYKRLTALRSRGGTDQDDRKVYLKGAQGLTENICSKDNRVLQICHIE